MSDLYVWAFLICVVLIKSIAKQKFELRQTRVLQKNSFFGLSFSHQALSGFSAIKILACGQKEHLSSNIMTTF
jgi:hypothetical protein